MTVTRAQLVAAARSYEGVGYRHLGRDRFGVDCLGLLVCAARDLALIPAGADWREYSRNAADYTLLEEMERSGYLLRLRDWREAREGDVILQKFHPRLPASHVLVVTAFDGTYWRAIHASNGTRRVVEQRVAHEERCFAGFRLKGVSDG